MLLLCNTKEGEDRGDNFSAFLSIQTKTDCSMETCKDSPYTQKISSSLDISELVIKH